MAWSGQDCAVDIQNKSPSAAAEPAASLASASARMSHSHDGYSESSKATGSCLPLRKLRPLSTVPAGTELLTVMEACEGFAGAIGRS